MDSSRSEPAKAESPFDDFYGLELEAAEDGTLIGHLNIRHDHHQVTGVVHGGVYASIGEAIASHGTNLMIAEAGMIAMGMTNATSFIRPASGGGLHASGRPLHRGRTTWVWDVTICDDHDRVCAVTRVTLAIRRRPEAL